MFMACAPQLRLRAGRPAQAASASLSGPAKIGNSLQGFRLMDNPFASPSPLPFELPPFDRIAISDYREAFEAGMRAQLQEVAAITQGGPPDFENTVVALERSGRVLERVA